VSEVVEQSPEPLNREPKPPATQQVTSKNWSARLKAGCAKLKVLWGAFKDGYPDYLYPRLEPHSDAQKDKDAARIERETKDLDARIKGLDAEALKALQTEFKELLTAESERRASVDARLSTIIGLTSVVAAIVFGALTFRAGAGFQYPQSWAVWVAAVITLYIVAQLFCAIQAALKGVGVRSSAAVNYHDTTPKLDEEKVAHTRRVLQRYLNCVHDQQENNNARVSQLLVAHCALRNFLFGVAALTIAIIAATLIPSDKEKDIVRELRADPAVYDALRGPQGYPGKAGKDGKDGKNGKDGKDGRDGKDGKDANSGSAVP
jgi:hypothetical protein